MTNVMTEADVVILKPIGSPTACLAR